MAADDQPFLPVTELAAEIAAGRLSPATLCEAYLTRIARFDGDAKAYITVAADAARAAAGAAQAEVAERGPRGPLHGIPYACKDLFATRGLRTTAGSRVLADWLPDHDAHAIERLAAAGAVLLARPTCTSSPMAPRARTPTTARRPIRGIRRGSRAARRAARRRRSPAGSPPSRSAPIPAVQLGCRRRCAAWSASSRATGG